MKRRKFGYIVAAILIVVIASYFLLVAAGVLSYDDTVTVFYTSYFILFISINALQWILELKGVIEK